jgi:hypothetical protein
VGHHILQIQNQDLLTLEDIFHHVRKHNPVVFHNISH